MNIKVTTKHKERKTITVKKSTKAVINSELTDKEMKEDLLDL